MRLAHLLLAFAVSGAAGVASAQCTKDTDCKGDRICGESGRCVAPTAKESAGASPVVPATGDFSPENLGRSFEDALKCTRSPEPGVALSVLSAAGYIGGKPKVVVDGMEVYGLRKPLAVFGFKVIEVTGFDPSLSKYRGPGTATPLNLAAVVEGDLAAVKAEVQKRGGASASVNRAMYSTYAKPAAEVTCFGK